MSIPHLIGFILAGLALVGAAFSLMAARFAGRTARQAQTMPEKYPPVTVLKPLHGLEPALEENLETFFALEYPAPVQLIFGVRSKSDPAIKQVERLCDRHPEVDAALTISARSHGFNGKVSNLANMAAGARHPILALSDGDIAVAPDYLRKVAAALTSAEIGAATCLYTGWAAGGIGSRFSAMGVCYHFLPNAIAGVSLGMAKPCMGSTIALPRKVLDEIGGFEAFADFLADDYEIGRAVREKGYRVAIPPFAVRHACGEKTMREWFAHELRWARTIRINDPFGHIGSIVTHPVPLALLAAFFAGFSAFSLGTLAATLAARAVLKWRIDRSFGADGGPLWLLPIRDVLAFGVFLVSLFGGRVEWQGERFRVARGGVLIED